MTAYALTPGSLTPDAPSAAFPAPRPLADLEALGDEIAELSAHIHAAQYRLLTLLRRFDRDGGWGPGGFRSCAHWLSWRIGLSLGPAREKVRVAHALAVLPLISERMERGQFSYSKVRALTRVATPANEAELIVFAEHGTVAQVERLVRGWRWLDRKEALTAEERRHQTRSVQVHVNDDGMYVVRALLDPEVGSLLMKALEAEDAALFAADPEATGSQRRADALGEVLRKGKGPNVHAVLHVTTESGAEAQTEEGVGVSAETSERLTCDAYVTEVKERAPTEPGPGRAAVILDVGRKRRTVSGRLRLALETRDQRACRFPGCGWTRCDAHHVRHWSRGGATKIDNLVLLCGFHHRLMHEGGFRVRVASSAATGVTVRFWRPDGREVVACPDTQPVTHPALHRWHAARQIDRSTTTPLGSWGRVEYNWALDGMRTG